VLLQDPDDLLFRKTIALHALVLVLGQSELQTGLSPRGKVSAARERAIMHELPVPTDEVRLIPGHRRLLTRNVALPASEALRTNDRRPRSA